MISNEIKEQIAYEVIRTLYNQFDKFPNDEINNRNAPFHEAFLSAFSNKLEGKVASIPIYISLASWLHGLNTSLGQSFFEKTANILCSGEKRGFIKSKDTGLTISAEQKVKINDIITDLTNGTRRPDSVAEFNECEEYNGTLVDSEDFTADVFFQDAEEIVCIELKTVQPNNSIFKAEKHKLLESKIALKNRYPNKRMKYYLGFPFDPLSDSETGYDKSRFMENSVNFKKYFSVDEILLSSELWDYLSRQSETMESIIEIINAIAKPNFLDKYNYLNNIDNRINDKNNYINQLESWYLFKERYLVNNGEKILEEIKKNNHLSRYYSNGIFNTSSSYNLKRYNILKEII